MNNAIHERLTASHNHFIIVLKSCILSLTSNVTREATRIAISLSRERAHLSVGSLLDL